MKSPAPIILGLAAAGLLYLAYKEPSKPALGAAPKDYPPQFYVDLFTAAQQKGGDNKLADLYNSIAKETGVNDFMVYDPKSSSYYIYTLSKSVPWVKKMLKRYGFVVRWTRNYGPTTMPNGFNYETVVNAIRPDYSFKLN